jgi:electron transfer flavoprotein alpha subunit
MNICVLITEESSLGGIINTVKNLGEVTAVVVGSESLAQKVATSGVHSVLHVETSLPETKSNLVAQALEKIEPKIILTTATPAARVIAGAVANTLDAVVVPGVVNIATENNSTIIEQTALSGRVLDTLTSEKPLIGFFTGEDTEILENTPVEIKTLNGEGYEMKLDVLNTNTGSSSLADASRVVSMGRGVRSKEDIPLIESLAKALDAQVGCSMPVADDLSWLPKECYVGRSGQKIAPRVYFAIGISGAPQHFEGVRGAKVIVAINNDPEARVFRSADYGIVGDLYEIIPALIEVLN